MYTMLTDDHNPPKPKRHFDSFGDALVASRTLPDDIRAVALYQWHEENQHMMWVARVVMQREGFTWATRNEASSPTTDSQLTLTMTPGAAST